MSILSSRRLDGPLDYRELWRILKLRIEELAAYEATTAMNDEDEATLRKRQGAYRFGYTVLSEMDSIVEQARASYGPLRQIGEDG